MMFQLDCLCFFFLKEESSFDFFHLPASSLSTNQYKAPLCSVTFYISSYW